MSLRSTEWPDGDAIKSSTECWQVIGIESALTFSLRHLVMSEIRGRFRRWGAILVLDRDDQSRALLKAWIDLASIDTGSCERDHHIRSAEFFDVARFPFAEFRSGEIVPLDAQRFVAHGALVLHGENRPLDLVVMPGPRREEAGMARASYEVRATIDRREFGLRWNQDLDVGGLVVGDRIDLQARVQAMRIPGGRPSDRH